MSLFNFCYFTYKTNKILPENLLQTGLMTSQNTFPDNMLNANNEPTLTPMTLSSQKYNNKYK